MFVKCAAKHFAAVVPLQLTNVFTWLRNSVSVTDVAKHLEMAILLHTSVPLFMEIFLQCFDAVGWAAGRASGL